MSNYIRWLKIRLCTFNAIKGLINDSEHFSKGLDLRDLVP